METTFLVLGGLFILLSLLSLVYQFFSASILAFIGIVFLNISSNLFDWYWLIWFAFLTVIASGGGFLLTLKASKKLPKNAQWMPIVFGILGAILIPLPFVGALIGVFIGTLCAMLFFSASGFSKQTLILAMHITYKSFLGIVLEISCVMLMICSLIVLAIF